MIWLLFAHFIGDWALQNDFMAKYKADRPIVMVAHCMIWTACICIAQEYISDLEHWMIYFLFVGHLIADYIKCLAIDRKWWGIYLDQLWHIIQCFIVSSLTVL